VREATTGKCNKCSNRNKHHVREVTTGKCNKSYNTNQHHVRGLSSFSFPYMKFCLYYLFNIFLSWSFPDLMLSFYYITFRFSRCNVMLACIRLFIRYSSCNFPHVMLVCIITFITFPKNISNEGKIMYILQKLMKIKCKENMK
jgi:hypothetical protein